MASRLLTILSRLETSTPDQIVAKLSDPFRDWRPTNSLTHDEYVAYRDRRIVVCNHSFRNNTSYHTERHHKLGAEDGGFHPWGWEDYSHGIFSSTNWWFRSLESFEGNPDEGFDL